MRRPDARTIVAEALPHAPTDVAMKSYPKVMEFLTASAYEGGAGAREPGSWSFRAMSGAWSVTLRDPSAGVMLRVQVEELGDMFAVLEGILADPLPPWEVDPYARKKPQKRK